MTSLKKFYVMLCKMLHYVMFKIHLISLHSPFTVLYSGNNMYRIDYTKVWVIHSYILYEVLVISEAKPRKTKMSEL